MDRINEMHWNAFERHLCSKHRSPETISNYRGAVELLVGMFPGEDLADLGQADIEEFIVDLLRRRSVGTAANRYRAVRAFYSWMVDEEITPTHPMKRMQQPSGDDKPPAVLADDDLRALFKACSSRSFDDRRDAAIMWLLCEPGTPRVSELVGILVDDVDLRPGREMVKLEGKGRKVRFIPFGAKTGQALDRYLRVRRQHKLAASPYLWLGNRGKPLTRWGVAQMLDRRGVQAGIGHIYPHQFRHTSAHVWFDQGGSESDAMELFGWSSPEMPRVYARSTRTERAQRAARRLSPTDRL